MDSSRQVFIHMLLHQTLVLQAVLAFAVYSQDFRTPRGFYAPRNWSSSTVSLKLNFLDDGNVKYDIHTPQGGGDTFDSFPVIMLGPNIIFSRVPQFRMEQWMDLYPDYFEELGLRVFFYDPILDRITVNALTRTFDIAHVSDPSRDLRMSQAPKKPSGTYKSVEQNLNVTMDFNEDNSRVTYNIKLQDKEYTFPFDVDFTMRSPGLIATLIPQNQLYGLHGRFPGLSTDYFYTNLGYDAVNDQITFLLDAYRIVNLAKVPETRNLVQEEGFASPVEEPCGHDCRPFGDFCIDYNGVKMSMSFKDQFTTTFAAHYRGKHLLAKGARYDVYEEADKVTVSVDVVNSDLNAELRKINWFGFTNLNFTFNHDDNILVLEERGLVANMHLTLGCAAAVEVPPEEPEVDQSKPRSHWGEPDDGGLDTFHRVIIGIIKRLLR